MIENSVITVDHTSESRTEVSKKTVHYRVVIVGGGTAGITVAARLRRADQSLDIAIIEPSQHHYYQPLWTLAGAGVVRKQITERPERALIPKNVRWLQDAVIEVVPEEKTLVTRAGHRVTYEFLVLAPGIQIDWDLIPSLAESLGHGGVCSVWSYESVDRTWEQIRAFRGGTAIFTMPNTPIKCPGAAQKIMYLADDHFRRSGVRDRTRIIYASAGTTIFGVEKYAKALNRVVARKGIETLYRHNLVELHPDEHVAVFDRLDTGQRVTLAYDLIHVAPPQSAPDFIKRSPLANKGGWAEVDKHTLRNVRWPDIFALGDATSTPNSKTGAAVRHQAPVVTAGLLAALSGGVATARYDGYAACPIVTGYGRLILAEFDYTGRPRETFPFDQSRERLSMYLLKRYGLPFLYWHGILRGRA